MIRCIFLAAVAVSFFGYPAWPQSVDDSISGFCLEGENKDSCEASRAEFRREFPKAYKGDYQSQRNVAYCLANGCDGAVRQNKILACAWRNVIITSGSNLVDDSDIMNFKLNCGKLDDVEKIAAEAQAKKIAEQIKNPACR